MKLILYSNPRNGVLEKIESKIFPKGKNVVFGYMPADGKNPKSHYTPFWQDLARKYNAEFVYIDNSKKPSISDIENLERINSLAIMGGNVFALLHNIRLTGLDKYILGKLKDRNFVYSGFSAGAMIATPDIRIADKGFSWSFGGDENSVGLKNTKALGLVDYEILPHYNKKLDKQKLEKFQITFKTKVVPLTDNDFIII